MSAAHKVWFLTGASSGLGRAMLDHLLEQGDRVVATMRKPDAVSDLTNKYPSEQLLVLKLDVTSRSEIKAAFSKAVEVFGRIDIVYNNAGYGILGEIEGSPEETARAVFDVNFWGATNVSLEAIKVFREVNKPIGGRLLQVSSLSAAQTVTGLGFYSASKHALEGISQGLANELHPSWNIKITLLQLGSFKTRAVADVESMIRLPIHPEYTGTDSATYGIRNYLSTNASLSTMGDASKAAREMRKIALDDTVELRVPIGVDALKTVKNEAEKKVKEADLAGKWSVDLGQ